MKACLVWKPQTLKPHVRNESLPWQESLNPQTNVRTDSLPWQETLTPLQGGNPYDVAESLGDRELMRLLVEYGARPSDAGSDWEVCCNTQKLTDQ